MIAKSRFQIFVTADTSEEYSAENTVAKKLTQAMVKKAQNSQRAARKQIWKLSRAIRM